MREAVQSALFLVGAVLVTAVFGVLVPLCGIASYRAALYCARMWARWLIRWVEWSCGIRCEVQGMENVPAGPAIIMAKHQSAWETLYIEATFPYQCWIIKRELLWLPFVGIGLLLFGAVYTYSVMHEPPSATAAAAASASASAGAGEPSAAPAQPAPAPSH